ncbi:MAG: hypothetical protein DSZ03_08925 [Sulfurimonas sp.]|nr:MAG: hypothetical protein DSZ03_08925 [Sulfurimonas sp.]
MKFLLVTALLASFFSGCSRTTAFDFFKMDANYERAISNLQTGTIARSFETEVILSSIYLNKVYPKQYNDAEYFFIALYLADNQQETLQNSEYKLTLNGVDFLHVKELQEDDPLRSLMPIDNEWNRYYLVTFAKQPREDLLLQLEDRDLNTIKLHYTKEKVTAKTP